MKINVSSISRSIDSSIEISGEVIVPVIDYNGEVINVKSPIKIDGLITNTGEHLLVKGNISAKLLLKCSRCLENFEYSLETSFEEALSNKKDNDDVIHFEGDILDLTDIIINNIMLALPMKFICSESCKGLCSVCGKNINVHECSCADEKSDPRLAVLKDLLKGN